ncbi:MAG: roadblock/LC7 domain-containing protein [Acidobacteria bacterium]|nr:roadblock/LC7 domain-containing protein [Acidobacteriota bacterium]
MATIKEGLDALMDLDGIIACCAVDSESGMMLAAAGDTSKVNLETAAAGNTEVVRSKRKTIKALGLNEDIEDILITLGKQFHIIRPLTTNQALFIYVVLDKSRGNLAMARLKLAAVEKDVTF